MFEPDQQRPKVKRRLDNNNNAAFTDPDPAEGATEEI